MLPKAAALGALLLATAAIGALSDPDSVLRVVFTDYPFATIASGLGYGVLIEFVGTAALDRFDRLLGLPLADIGRRLPGYDSRFDEHWADLASTKRYGWGEPELADMHAQLVFLSEAPPALIASVKELREFRDFADLSGITALVPAVALTLAGLARDDIFAIGIVGTLTLAVIGGAGHRKGILADQLEYAFLVSRIPKQGQRAGDDD